MVDTVGQRIQQRRVKLAVSRKELAKLSGLAYSTISDWESGCMKSSTKLHAVAKALRTSIEWLETGEGPEESDTPAAAQESRQFWGFTLSREAAEVGAEWMKLAEADADMGAAFATLLGTLVAQKKRGTTARRSRRKTDRPGDTAIA